MREVHFKIFTPDDALPISLDKHKQNIVLINCRYGKSESWGWNTGFYLGRLIQEWRATGSNSEVEVREWMQLPKQAR